MAGKKTGKGKGNKKVIIVVVCAAVVLGAIGLASTKGSAGTEADAGYKIATAQVADVNQEIEASGVVVESETLSIFTPAEMMILDVYVENGDVVNKGDKIATVDVDDIDEKIEEIEQSIRDIDAEFDEFGTEAYSDEIESLSYGIVKEIFAEEGQSVEETMQADDALMLISVDGSMRVEAKVENISDFEIDTTVYCEIDGDVEEFPIFEINEEKSEIVIILEDDEYVEGQVIDIMDEKENVLAVGTMHINVPLYITGSEGIVDEIKVEVDDKVSKGNVLIELDRHVVSKDFTSLSGEKEELMAELEELEQDIEELGLTTGNVIYAEASGIIDGLGYDDDRMGIQENTALMEDAFMYNIKVVESLSLEVEVDELDIAGVDVGETAKVTFDALKGKQYNATVAKINPIGISENNVTKYTVTLELENNTDILIGMSADVDILAEVKQGVVTIPIEAVQIINDVNYVIPGEKAGQTNTADQMIEIGVSDGVVVEVTSGLAEGDTVVIPAVNTANESEETNEMQPGPSADGIRQKFQ